MKNYTPPKVLPREADILQFLSSLPLPKLDLNAQNERNAEISLQEVLTAIQEFPSGKVAGPDGLGIEFYAVEVAPLLLRREETDPSSN